jgi:hypothetical protein
VIKDAGRNIDFREYAARCLVRREGTEQVDLLVISIHSGIPDLPGKRLMVSRQASQGCEAIFLSRFVAACLHPPGRSPWGMQCVGERAPHRPRPYESQATLNGIPFEACEANYWRMALVAASSIM